MLAAAAALLVGARLLGSAELAGLAAAAGLAVAAAAVVVARAPLTYRAERRLSPARVGAGETASARLRFTNSGRAPTAGAAVATDGLDVVASPAGGPPAGGRAAAGRRDAPPGDGRCLVPALGPGSVAEASYGVPTARRGVVEVGPLSITVGDPLGLVERRAVLLGPARLLVHPRIHPVLALPASSRDARLGRAHPARAPQGDDFFALREYELGDDLRRVHWRSTARTGDLMLRQDELRFGEVATVLLDTRAAAQRGDSFERALEVAASVAAALVDDGRRLRFVTTGGFEAEVDGTRAAGAPPGGRAESRWNAVLEHLAGVGPDGGGTEHFARALRSIARRPSGPLAAVVAAAAPAELAGLGALSGRLGLVMIARCDAPAGPAGAVPGATVVAAGAGGDFAAVWNEAVLACSRRDVVRR